MKLPWLLRLLAALLLSGWLPLAAWAQQAVPALSGRVIDQTGTLQPAERQALEAQLAALEQRQGAQVVVLMVASTAPEDIASYAQRVGDQWKLGRRGVGDGLLLVVAKDDRRVWIATAKTLEGAVPDLAARQIIQNHITPAFKRGEFAAGLQAGIEQLSARIAGEGLPPPSATPEPDWGELDLGWSQWLMFFFVGVAVAGRVLTAMFGRRFGSLLAAGAAGALAWFWTHSLWLAVGVGVVTVVVVGVLGLASAVRRSGNWTRGRSGPVIWGGGSGGGWSSGGGGGGGFSSGGGGDFGGGGAGGSW